MILGRSPALWLGFVTAGLNVLVVVFGIRLDAIQLAGLNVFFGALIGIVANETDPTTVPTLAPTLRDRRDPENVYANGHDQPGQAGAAPTDRDLAVRVAGVVRESDVVIPQRRSGDNGD